MMLLRPPGVYRPQTDTRLLGETLAAAGIPDGAAVLDIGCGTGALSVAAARLRPRSITAVDVSRRAVLAAWLNLRLRRAPAEVLLGDAFETTAGRLFDVVLANPPYVPGNAARPRGRNRAWDAGVDGRALLDRLCANLPLLLAPGGTALVVHSRLSDEDRTLRQLRGGGLKAAVVGRAEVPYGPVMRARRRTLAELGLVGDTDDTEELVVIRGDRAA